jgi:hypothetical protein
MGYFDVGAAFFRRQIVADYCAPRFVVVPIRDPGIGQQAGRIIFDDFAFALEIAYAIDTESGLRVLIAKFTAAAGFQFEFLHAAVFAGPPGHYLLRVDQGVEYSLGRSGYEDFAYHCVLI